MDPVQICMEPLRGKLHQSAQDKGLNLNKVVCKCELVALCTQ